jgi:hypothetical protein
VKYFHLLINPLGSVCYAQLVKRAPPLISQSLRGIIEAKRSQSLENESCDRSASMMPCTCCGIKGGARFTNCVIARGEATIVEAEW